MLFYNFAQNYKTFFISCINVFFFLYLTHNISKNLICQLHSFFDPQLPEGRFALLRWTVRRI